MTRIILPIFGVIFAFSVSSLSYAHYDGYTKNIKEGLFEVVKSPLAIVDAVKEETTASTFKPIGVFSGIIKGSFHTVQDVTSGIFRVLTFNVEDDNFLLKPFKKEKKPSP